MRKNQKGAIGCDNNTLNLHSVSDGIHSKNTDKKSYHQSAAESSGVIFKIGNSIHFYQLRKITHFVFSENSSTLFFKYSGLSRRIVYGEGARLLYSALTAYHGVKEGGENDG